MKRILLGIALIVGLSSLAAADTVSGYIQRKKVVVNTTKVELCFADDGQYHPVLIGKTTPKGKLNMTPMMTSKPGYGGEVIGFKEENDFLFVLHRVWALKPQERRMERIASPDVADRIVTNGCINVQNNVYEKLHQYFILEII